MPTPFPRALAAAALLGLALASAGAHAQADAVVDAGPAVPFLDGGVGKTERADMARLAHDYNLRLVFSERLDHELAAGVDIAVLDAAERLVFMLEDAGPQTDLRLPPGRYRVFATLHGQREEQSVDVKASAPTRLAFHWRGAPKFDPFDGRPVGGRQIPG